MDDSDGTVRGRPYGGLGVLIRKLFKPMFDFPNSESLYFLTTYHTNVLIHCMCYENHVTSTAMVIRIEFKIFDQIVKSIIGVIKSKMQKFWRRLYAKRHHSQSSHLGKGDLFMKHDVIRQNADFLKGIECIIFNIEVKPVFYVIKVNLSALFYGWSLNCQACILQSDRGDKLLSAI